MALCILTLIIFEGLKSPLIPVFRGGGNNNIFRFLRGEKCHLF